MTPHITRTNCRKHLEYNTKKIYNITPVNIVGISTSYDLLSRSQNSKDKLEQVLSALVQPSTKYKPETTYLNMYNATAFAVNIENTANEHYHHPQAVLVGIP